MFNNLTPEQREAFVRRTHRVDALLKSAVETQPAPKKTPLRRLHLVPNLHLNAPQEHGAAQVA
jgi:hypothetical protein